MKRRAVEGPIRLPTKRRWGVYAVAIGIWASGAAWLVLRYWLRRQGEFGPETNPLEPWALRAHGAFAFATLWALGLLWGAHVLNGWGAKRRRWSGAGLLGFLLFLTLTGYLLYYAGGDELRAVISPLHWVVGLGAPVLFILHRFAREKR